MKNHYRIQRFSYNNLNLRTETSWGSLDRDGH